MAYNNDGFRQAACYTEGRNGNSITEIVVHHWDDPAKKPTFNGVVSWFQNPNCNVSIHYVLEAGHVLQMVREQDTAWHAGNWDHNQRSIGIECNPRCSDEDKATLAELIADIKTRYPNARIVGHKDVSDNLTSCPGRYYEPNQVLASYLDGKAPEVSHTAVPAPTAPVDGDLNALADRVIAGEFGDGQARIDALGDKYDAVQAIVNQRFSGTYTPTPITVAPTVPGTVDLSALADRVIAGEFGDGQDRIDALGPNYSAVQEIVNQKLDGGYSAPTGGVDLNALADRVIAGEFGDGDDRVAALGSNYQAVQDIVNQRLS